MTVTTSRREFIAVASAATALSALGGSAALAQESMPRRPIPSTGEMLPIIGLGSSKVVSEVSENGTEPLAAVLRALRARGGSVVDTWPRDATDDAGLGRVLAEPDLRDSLFVTTKVHLEGREAGIRQFRQTQELYGRQTLDLAQTQPHPGPGHPLAEPHGLEVRGRRPLYRRHGVQRQSLR